MWRQPEPAPLPGPAPSGCLLLRLRPCPGRRAGWHAEGKPLLPSLPEHPPGAPVPSKVERPVLSPEACSRLRPAGPQPAVLSGAAGRWTPWELSCYSPAIRYVAKKVKCRTLRHKPCRPARVLRLRPGQPAHSQVGRFSLSAGREVGTYTAWAVIGGPERTHRQDTLSTLLGTCLCQWPRSAPNK